MSNVFDVMGNARAAPDAVYVPTHDGAKAEKVAFVRAAATFAVAVPG